jgi:GTPase SAR1 family protein
MSISDGLTIMVVGDGGVGKTAFIRKACYPASDIEKKYYPTSGTEMYNFENKRITHVLIDTSGQEKFSPHQLSQQIDAVIVMYTAGNKISYKNTTQWIEKVKKQYGDVYIVLCATKISDVDCYYPTAHTEKDSPFNLKVFHIDAASGYMVLAPINNIFKHFENKANNLKMATGSKCTATPNPDPKLDFTIDPTEFQKVYLSIKSHKSIKDYQADLRVVVDDLNKKIAIARKKITNLQFLSRVIDDRITSLESGQTNCLFDEYPDLVMVDSTVINSLIDSLNNQNCNIAKNMGFVIKTYYNK